MSEQISITCALAEIKTLDARIVKATNERYVEMSVGGSVVGSNRSEDETKAAIKQKFQSFTDLVKRRNALKCAIVSSNANTKVKIGDKEMLVAEAIECKNSIAFEEQMINNLRSQHRTAISKVESTNIQANQRLDQMIEVNLGKDRKASADDYDVIAKPFMAKNEAKLIDPLDLEALVQQLQNDVDEFKLNV